MKSRRSKGSRAMLSLLILLVAPLACTNPAPVPACSVQPPFLALPMSGSSLLWIDGPEAGTSCDPLEESDWSAAHDGPFGGERIRAHAGGLWILQLLAPG